LFLFISSDFFFSYIFPFGLNILNCGVQRGTLTVFFINRDYFSYKCRSSSIDLYGRY